jgi:hypothetical protein
MDRLNESGVPFAAVLDSATTGWDSHRVWRERVHEARRAPDAEAPAISLLLGRSAGWDPHETWRIRVQRPRRLAK